RVVIAVLVVGDAVVVVVGLVAAAAAAVLGAPGERERARAVVGAVAGLAVAVLVDIDAGVGAAGAGAGLAAQHHAGARIGGARDQLALGGLVGRRARGGQGAEGEKRDEEEGERGGTRHASPQMRRVCQDRTGTSSSPCADRGPTVRSEGAHDRCGYRTSVRARST